MADGFDVGEILSGANLDWTPLGEGFAKCYMNYDELEWKVDLANQKAVVAPYGGSIAVLTKHEGWSDITTYTLAAKKIGFIKLEGGKIVGMGWTASEDLVLIYDDGTMVVYTVHGVMKFQRLLAREIRDHRVAQVRFFHSIEGFAGFAVMTFDYHFYVVADSDRDKDDIRVKTLAELPSGTLNTCPSCWAVMPSGKNVGVIAVVEGQVYLMQSFETVPISVACKDSNRQWTSIAISLSGKAAALIDKTGYIWAGSSDFKSQEVEFDIQSSSNVLQMEWSGNDFIVLLYEKFIFLKGLAKHWCKLPSKGPCVLAAEIDGVRLVTNTTCEFIHRVPKSSLSVLKVASLQPGAILNDAYKEYIGDESHKADEYIRYIKDKLPDAVLQCISAASEEFEPKIQQALLMSANFGKGFLGPDVSDDIITAFVETARNLRVLNFVRDPAIGIPITYRQFSRLSPGVLVDRLTNHRQYPVALEICNYLKLPSDVGEVKVLTQWALHKVRDKTVSDTKVANMILTRFKSCGIVISYADIARVARQEDRRTLAAQLLEHEVLVEDQVQMLLEMDEADKALDKATSSWDAQLVYEVLERMKGSQRTSDYMKVFNHRPTAAALYKKYCKENDSEGLVNLCHQESDFVGAGIHLLSQAYRVAKPKEEKDEKERKEAKERFLVPRQELVKQAYKEFTDGQLSFHMKVIEDQDRLHREQTQLKEDHKFDTVGLTLFSTIMECVRRSQFKVADNLKKKFAMPDTLFWWAKLRALASVANFEEIERFSKQKKSPIGYEPFVEVCLQKNRFTEANKYIPRCPPNKRCRLYMITGDWHKAAETAASERNIAALDEMLQRQGRNDAALVDYIKQIKMKLGAQ
ncbi:PREDICTED: vacuolar protein sorting-associated protein 16 homolog [Amphimedon queenslandica]|uniref:Vacuolar protein sorting-associated protein 16 homolog n=1 Tax=Amphimedon queenslandica TaxID=400682 RepID=A0A1X7V6T3_AMPQE|nr:PREDICTED: vacuolar protein sorting-associated protein 16 homolog [Amphimedon queenslandica]|eukprot:XP_019850373.1 PREDICTED: vacuolar protein sorting-associated protein 16 homolog [Amphimedon queenslandica]